jgi:DNA-directed RNA polymerase specialized sigma24 family protein
VTTGYCPHMATGKSEALAARRRAAQRVQEHMEREARVLTDAVTEAMEAAELRASLTEQIAAADSAFRASIGALANLGKTPDEIAALVDVPVTEVRAARRAPRGARADSDDNPPGAEGEGESEESVRSTGESQQPQLVG